MCSHVAIRRIPSHQGITGNERADEFSRTAAERSAPQDEVPDEHRRETSLAHMTRAATKAKTRDTGEWIPSHFRAGRKYRPPGRGL